MKAEDGMRDTNLLASDSLNMQTASGETITEEVGSVYYAQKQSILES